MLLLLKTGMLAKALGLFPFISKIFPEIFDIQKPQVNILFERWNH